MEANINTYFLSFIKNPSISNLLSSAQVSFLANNIYKNEDTSLKDISKSIRLTATLINIIISEEDSLLNDDDLRIINDAYYLIRSINIENTEIQEAFKDYFNIEAVSGSNTYYFVLSALGLLSNNSVKVRIDLESYNYAELESPDDWKNYLINGCISALILLIRKKNGLEDINAAFHIIDNLKKIQKNYEEKYLDSLKIEAQVNEAYFLLSFYHIAKMLSEASEYIRLGYIYEKNISEIIKSHYSSSLETIKSANSSDLALKIFKSCINKIYRNSIWYHTDGLGSKIESLCKKLSNENILDLLPSQQDAISQNLLDTASNVTVVQMPTSAGKSLLAEFKILQTLSLNNNAKILYIVPNRALVNQVLHDLREDLSDLSLVIEKTSRSNDLDPTENVLLQEKVDILISTPEKADLLIRKSHESVEDISLVVVDEAHTIKDGDRGARLELLLSIIKRELPKARFMLLSPFMPNAQNLTNWLATGRNALKPIQVSWKPADKVFVGVSEQAKNFKLTLLPSAYSLNSLKSEFEIKVPKTSFQLTKPKERLLEFTAKHFSKDKRASLYLCWGKGTADSMAKNLQNIFPNENCGDLTKLVSKFIEEEAGCETVLSKSLKSRIAIHHAGLTDDSKSLVEMLIRKREINHVCATTTVANGMNFPISTVYFDDYRKGRDGKLTHSDFLNITGRAGRTLVDNVGTIVFPFNSSTNTGNAKNYIQQEVNNVTSALSGLIVNADKISRAFSSSGDGLSKGQLFSENKSLGVLVQYLIHLLTVSNNNLYINKLEDLFKDSYGYYSLESQDSKDKFIDLCKSIYLNLQKTIKKGTLSLSDKTGFSVPSVLQIMRRKSDDTISSPASWEPENLFNNKNPYLSNKISILGDLRDLELGTEGRGNAPFSPEHVAAILTGWVKGERLEPLSKIHPFFKALPDDDRMNAFISYLSSTTFKSSWGLSVIEGIVKGDDDTLVDSSHVPSMVYYGVYTPRAVALRMLGAPRTIADNLAEAVIKKDQKGSFSSYRKAINSLTSSDWDSITPNQSILSGSEWREVTKALIQ